MKKLFLAVLMVSLIVVFTISVGTKSQAKQDNVRLKVFVHEPNPGKPVAPSYCTATTNDQVNDYGLAGWHMPASGMNYKINFTTKPQNLSDATILGATQNSFAAWNTADVNQLFTYTGATSAKTAKRDGVNAILFKSIQMPAIAITYAWSSTSTGELLETDTIFNKSYSWSYTDPSAGDCAGVTGTYDLQNIATHEFGHWAGLDDLYGASQKDLTMYGYGDLKELKKNSLGLGDITGINTVLP